MLEKKQKTKKKEVQVTFTAALPQFKKKSLLKLDRNVGYEFGEHRVYN
jgi:hypothetical protein